MAKRGDWLKNRTPAERREIAASGGVSRAKSLTKKRRKAIASMGGRVWRAIRKAKNQALSE